MSDQLEDTDRIAERLRALTDEDLDRFHTEVAAAATAEAKRRAADGEGLKVEEWSSDPVSQVWTELVCMASNEKVRRRVALHRMEADLQGGHLVEVLEGRELDTYSAVCDPLMEEETISCWAGPDRATVDEAIEDARAHHPGHEPRVLVDP